MIPTLNITFKQAAKKTAAKLTRGTVAVIVKDTAQALAGTVAEVSTVADIPAALSADNKKYIERALFGGDQKPKRVYVAVMGSDGTYAATLAALAKYSWTGWRRTPSAAHPMQRLSRHGSQRSAARARCIKPCCRIRQPTMRRS